MSHPLDQSFLANTSKQQALFVSTYYKHPEAILHELSQSKLQDLAETAYQEEMLELKLS